ncbi:ComEA family DNA-binding protein [Microbacterium album]|uniref:ComEA family DNA-binding protein n=1 Tax=Microbacterium album TaxID=2053191 RepID=UPI001E400AA1|nr:ComEA family DNA-binding protein [Microbacterium album]
MSEIEGISAPPRRGGFGVSAVIVLVLAALAVTIGIGLWRGATAPVEVVPDALPSPEVSVAAGRIYVHVDGEVNAPGLYVLPAGARVVDAIAAAGGFAEEAERGAVNLARVVSDGEQLHVPAPGAEGEHVAPGSTGGAGASSGAANGSPTIDLNSASAAELESLPRIGPALAQRILEWREQNGRFTSVDDLLAVSGIGERVLESLRPLVRVG